FVLPRGAKTLDRPGDGRTVVAVEPGAGKPVELECRNAARHEQEGVMDLGGVEADGLRERRGRGARQIGPGRALDVLKVDDGRVGHPALLMRFCGIAIPRPTADVPWPEVTLPVRTAR